MIRASTRDDIPDLLVLVEAMHAESRFSQYGFNRKQLTELFHALVDTPNGIIFVIENAGEIVGFLAGQTGETYLCLAKVAFEHMVYVRRPERGSYAAVPLIKAFIQWAKGHDVAYIQMGVNSGIDDERVTKLYKRLGFSHVGQALEMIVR
jgi:L-amino acid N-acyltransferase YncA